MYFGTFYEIVFHNYAIRQIIKVLYFLKIS